MEDTELCVLIDALETRSDLSVADFDGVISFPRPETTAQLGTGHQHGGWSRADGFPNCDFYIRSPVNNKGGRWRSTQRKGDLRGNDAAIGKGRFPVLAQAALAASISHQ